MIDVQLLAIAGAILVVVIIISCFLLFGNRERSFEDALAERKGLNILLSGGADVDHKKHGLKDQKKKPKIAAAARKLEHKAKTEEPKNDPEFEQNETFDVVSAAQNAGVIDSPSSAEQESTETAKKSNAKKHAVKKEKAVKQAYGEGAYVGSDTQLNKSLKSEENEILGAIDSTPVEQIIALSKRSELNAENIPVVATEVIKNKKQKTSGKFDRGPSRSVEPEFKLPQTFDNTDEEICLNSTLRRLNLPILSDAQQDVVAEFYSNNGPWAPSKVGGKVSAEIVSFGQLRKQIEEKDVLLTKDAQKISATLQSLKDAKQENLHEKERFAANERNLKEKLVSLQNEHQSMSQKIMEYQTQMAAKLQAYRQMEAQLLQFRLEQNNLAQLQQENQRIKERVSSAEQENLTRNSELQRLKQEIINRDGQIHRFEQQRKENDQIRVMHEAGVSQQLMDSQNKLMTKDQECSQLMEEVKVLRNEFSLLEQDHEILRHQLMEKETRVQTLSYETASENNAKKELERCQAELAELKPLFESAKTNEQRLCDEMNSEFSKQLAEKEDYLKKFMVEKENNMGKLRGEIDSLHKQLTKISKEKEVKEDFRYKELESALNAKNKLDVDISQLKADLESSLTRLNEKETMINKMKKDFDSAKECLAKTEKTVEMLKNELQSAKVADDQSSAEQLEQMQQQIQHLDTTLSRRNATIKHLEDQIKEQTEKSHLAEQDSTSLRRLCETMKTETESLVQICETAQSEKLKLTEQLKLQQNGSLLNGHPSDVSGVVIDPEVLKVNERSMTQLNKQLINKDVEMAHLKEQIEALREKNFTLKNEKYNAIEAIQLMEKNVKELADKAEAKLKDEVYNLQRQTREKFTFLLPNEDSSTKSYMEWLCDCENALKKFTLPGHAERLMQSTPSTAKDSAETTGLLQQIGNLRKENDSLRDTCETYKTSLADTERALERLEKHVLEYEHTCDSKRANLEKQLKELKNETCRLEEQLKSSTQQLSERDALIKKEKATAKEVSAQATKLRGMLKTGQDALKQEQSLVEELNTHFRVLQEDKGNRALQEQIEELRIRLQQRDDQLEKEVQINKHLNNKLESASIMSVSSGSTQ